MIIITITIDLAGLCIGGIQNTGAYCNGQAGKSVQHHYETLGWREPGVRLGGPGGPFELTYSVMPLCYSTVQHMTTFAWLVSFANMQVNLVPTTRTHSETSWCELINPKGSKGKQREISCKQACFKRWTAYCKEDFQKWYNYSGNVGCQASWHRVNSHTHPSCTLWTLNFKHWSGWPDVLAANDQGARHPLILFTAMPWECKKTQCTGAQYLLKTAKKSQELYLTDILQTPMIGWSGEGRQGEMDRPVHFQLPRLQSSFGTMPAAPPVPSAPIFRTCRTESETKRLPLNLHTANVLSSKNNILS